MATTNETIIAEMSAAPRRNSLWIASKGVKEEKSDGDSLAAVVKACKNGDREAYRQLYESCHQSVFRLSVRMVGLQDAVDVTQQVFLQAFRSLVQFNGRSRFETWLYRLAVNESLQHLRRNRRWKYQALDWEPMDETPDGENVERKELIEHALALVDPQLRTIFLLRESEGLSYHDLAKALDIPEGTVGSRLNRARCELQQVLSDLGFELP